MKFFKNLRQAADQHPGSTLAQIISEAELQGPGNETFSHSLNNTVCHQATNQKERLLLKGMRNQRNRRLGRGCLIKTIDPVNQQVGVNRLGIKDFNRNQTA